MSEELHQPLPIRAVLDTNVLISALIKTDSPPDRVLRAWRRGAFELIISSWLLDEFASVVERPSMSRHIPQAPERAMALRRELEETALLVVLSGTPPAISRDPSDDLILQIAVEGNAQFIVTGDEDLLVLKQLNGISIVTTTQFLALL